MSAAHEMEEVVRAAGLTRNHAEVPGSAPPSALKRVEFEDDDMM